jgi:hypothetical protein
MSIRKLFLDDERFPKKAIPLITHNHELYENESEWVIVRNYGEFVEWITENGLPDYVSFDHDLADIKYNPTEVKMGFSYYEQTGFDCAKWLVDYCLDNNLSLPEYMVHSANPVGRKNIEGYLSNAKKHLNI